MSRYKRVAMLFALCGAAACAAQAQNCSDRDFNGVYSALVTGSFITPPTPEIPAGLTARVGRVQVDGAGHASIIATLSLLGYIFPESYGGTYTINPDCTANVILQVLFPGSTTPVPFHFLGTLADGGNGMDLILVNPAGTDLRIVEKKLLLNACSNSDLIGSYSLSMAGTNFFAPVSAEGLFASVGTVFFDGRGQFTASVNSSYDGAVGAQTFSGTYTVASNCILQTSYTLAGNASGWTGVLYGTSAGAYLLASAPQGSVVTGTLTSIASPGLPGVPTPVY